jgi:hypothetical protein
MNNNERIYDEKMSALERRTGSSKQWDFRTLHMTYPHLADVLHKILIAEGIVDADVEIQRHYVPRRICNW